MAVCCVKDCNVSRNDNTDKYTFHRFPTDPEMASTWAKLIGRDGWTPSEWSVVCSRHFEEKCIVQRPKQRRLVKGSTLTLFVPINKDDGLPQHICRTCITKLNAACRFKNMVIASHRKLNELKMAAEVKNDIEQDIPIHQIQHRVSEIDEDIKTDNIITDHIKPESIEYDLDTKNSEDCKENSGKEFFTESPNTKQNEMNAIKINYDTIVNMAILRQSAGHSRQDSSSMQVQETSCEQEKLKCQTCCYYFNTTHELEQHIKAHTFTCNVFCETLQLEEAEMKKTQEDLIQCECETCGRQFANKTLLKKHLQKHMKNHNRKFDAGYVCCHCGKQFKWSTSLLKHQRYHTGNLYTCVICDKGFADSTYLKSHLMKHYNPDKTFDCDDCGKSYSQMSGLGKHRAKIHKEKVTK